LSSMYSLKKTIRTIMTVDVNRQRMLKNTVLLLFTKMAPGAKALVPTNCECIACTKLLTLPGIVSMLTLQ
jgi:hypothetical protein